MDESSVFRLTVVDDSSILAPETTNQGSRHHAQRYDEKMADAVRYMAERRGLEFGSEAA